MKLILVIAAFAAQTVMATSLPVCDRTPAVKAFIEKAVSKTCDAITDQDLLTIKRISVEKQNIFEFKPDDFTGLTNLEILNIRSNPYTELPEGLLRDLVNLKTIVIIDTKLRHLPDDFLAYSNNWEEIHVFESPFRTISESVFKRIESQTHLKQLSLDVKLQDAEKARLNQRFPTGGPVFIEWNERS